MTNYLDETRGSRYFRGDMKIKLSQSITGELRINGKPASEKINGLFRVTTDSLDSWRKDDRARFESLMIDAGLGREAKAILSSLP